MQDKTLKHAHREPDDFTSHLTAIAQHSDRSAFAALYQHYAPKVKALALRMGVEWSGADEVTQEVMLAVWRRASTYDRSQASVSTWIYAIARNRVIDRIRKITRAEVDPHDPAFEPAEAPDTDARIDARRRARRLRAALQELPGDQAEVLRVSYFEGKSQSRIAEDLDLPLGTVKSRTRLGLARLRRTLEESE